MKIMLCFHCNRPLKPSFAEVAYDGIKVKVHHACVQDHQRSLSPHRQSDELTAANAQRDVARALQVRQ